MRLFLGQADGLKAKTKEKPSLLTGEGFWLEGAKRGIPFRKLPFEANYMMN